MRYSTEPKFRKYVKRYNFLLFARKFGDKYSKKSMDTAIKTEIDAVKLLQKSSSKNCRSYREFDWK